MERPFLIVLICLERKKKEERDEKEGQLRTDEDDFSSLHQLGLIIDIFSTLCSKEFYLKLKEKV